jgi:ADP-ribosylglycohydrolase
MGPLVPGFRTPGDHRIPGLADFEDAIRLAVSLGGDADTQAAITGGIAQAFYRHVPALIAVKVRSRLPAEFIDVIDQFDDRFLWWHEREVS